MSIVWLEMKAGMKDLLGFLGESLFVIDLWIVHDSFFGNSRNERSRSQRTSWTFLVCVYCDLPNYTIFGYTPRCRVSTSKLWWRSNRQAISFRSASCAQANFLLCGSVYYLQYPGANAVRASPDVSRLLWGQLQASSSNGGVGGTGPYILVIAETCSLLKVLLSH